MNNGFCKFPQIPPLQTWNKKPLKSFFIALIRNSIIGVSDQILAVFYIVGNLLIVTKRIPMLFKFLLT